MIPLLPVPEQRLPLLKPRIPRRDPLHRRHWLSHMIDNHDAPRSWRKPHQRRGKGTWGGCRLCGLRMGGRWLVSA
ncbi:hypothetical protein SFR_5001 [Streptomyces sp. FR-008]|nr:hypothetical protein SFR_5001 [Streptomyces sp. FR-008]